MIGRFLANGMEKPALFRPQGHPGPNRRGPLRPAASAETYDEPSPTAWLHSS